MSDDASLPAVRRRRWPRIVALLFLLAVVGGFVFWFMKPQTVTATALFQVRRDIPSIAGYQSGQRGTDQDYEILKKTQLALLKTKFLLTSALRDPGIASLSVLAGVRGPEEWLQNHLDLSCPENGELLAISLSGPASQANDLTAIVNAVAESYSKEVLGQEKDLKLRQRDLLERSLQNLQSQIKRKSEDYLDIAKGMGRPESDNDVQTRLDMKRLDRVDEELAQLEREHLRIESGSDSKDSKFIAARTEQLRKRQIELERNILRRNERSVDLETRGEELKQLQQIANDLSLELEKLDIDAQSPARIRQVQPATINDVKIARQ